MSQQGFTNGGSIAGVATSVTNNILSQTQGIISAKPTVKYGSGPRTTLKINNKLAGFAFAIGWKITTENVEIRTIDDYLPAEIAPNRVTVEGILGAFVIPGQSMTSQLIQADILSFLFQRYITIEVRDSATDNILFKTNQAVITSRATDLTAEKLGNIQLTWKAIGWLDEISPTPPNGFDQTGNNNATASSGSRLITAAGSAASKVGQLFS